jgi:REP element-mobilizing transposase RayT
MARRLRFIPTGGALVEITCRTVHGRFLLRPSWRLNRIIFGLLARAKRKYPVEIHAFVFLSNHYHLLVSVPDARRLASFMNYFNGNLAREAGRLANWHEKFWSRRYQAIVVSKEPAAQVSRLEYILAHGVKEGLVRRPSQWPGVHCVQALISGASIDGVWIDRTKVYHARIRGERVHKRDIESPEVFSTSPLPCWSHLDAPVYRARIAQLIERIERAGEKKTGALHLPASPHDRSLTSKRSPAPAFHCVSRSSRRDLLAAYRWFVAAYRQAAERLNRGDPSPGFPEGSFPPSLPFVAHA